MSITSSRSPSAAVPPRRKPNRPKKVDFQEPALDGMPQHTGEPRKDTRAELTPAVKKAIAENEQDRPTDHKGIPVEHEELVGNLPGIPFKISRLHLADGTTASACRSCLFTADTRAEVAEHRNAEHGARYGKGRKPLTLPIERAPDLVLSPRDDGTQPPSNPLDWTFRELLAVMPSIGQFADFGERMERERDAALAENQYYRKHKAQIDNYDALSDEVVELRLKIRSTGTYEELAAEVKDLRDFKKKIVARLSHLGFKFNEED